MSSKRASESSSPPANRAKAAKLAAKQEGEMTPYTAYFAKFEAVMEKNHTIFGSVLIRGISHTRDSDDEDDEYEDDEEKDTSNYKVHDGFYQFKSRRYAKAKSPVHKFELLLAYTFMLREYDLWMHDNEGGMEGMVKDLADMWKPLLKNTDEKLGIDTEYTRPGVVQLLTDFKEKIEGSYFDPHFKFKFQ
ncbi:hypothetical protein ACHAWF_006720 [Thalassiosira exigua]